MNLRWNVSLIISCVWILQSKFKTFHRPTTNGQTIHVLYERPVSFYYNRRLFLLRSSIFMKTSGWGIKNGQGRINGQRNGPLPQCLFLLFFSLSTHEWLCRLAADRELQRNDRIPRWNTLVGVFPRLENRRLETLVFSLFFFFPFLSLSLVLPCVNRNFYSSLRRSNVRFAEILGHRASEHSEWLII